MSIIHIFVSVSVCVNLTSWHNLVTTCCPLGNPFGYPRQPLGDHLVKTWCPLDDHLVSTWVPFGTTWQPLGDHLVTTWVPLGSTWITKKFSSGWAWDTQITAHGLGKSRWGDIRAGAWQGCHPGTWHLFLAMEFTFLCLNLATIYIFIPKSAMGGVSIGLGNDCFPYPDRLEAAGFSLCRASW